MLIACIKKVILVSKPSSFCFWLEPWIPFIFIAPSKAPKHVWTELNATGVENDSICYPAAELPFDYSVKSAPATSSWINGSTAALQSGDTDVILNYLWGLVYHNHALFHLCPVEAKLLTKGVELLSEGHHSDGFNLHLSAIIGGKLGGGGAQMSMLRVWILSDFILVYSCASALHLSMWRLSGGILERGRLYPSTLSSNWNTLSEPERLSLRSFTFWSALSNAPIHVFIHFAQTSWCFVAEVLGSFSGAAEECGAFWSVHVRLWHKQMKYSSHKCLFLCSFYMYSGQIPATFNP